jgi:hypothetical protein
MGEQQPAGLMRLRTAPAITPTRELIDQVLLPALGSTTLKPTTFYKHAVVSIYGDGDPQVTQTVTIGAFTTTISGSQTRAFTISNDNLTIQATNNDIGNARRTSTIEILSLEWG